MLLNLPEEFHEDIFLRVPAVSILASRCVCKLFYNLLTKPNFIKNHVNRTNQNKSKNPKLLFSHSSLGDPPMIYSIPIDYASISSAPPPSSSSVISSLSCVFDGSVLINYPFESENSYSLDILGSCNGLICLEISSFDTSEIEREKLVYSIFNPLTREFKEFAGPGVDGYIVNYGFGYDSNIDDYKLGMISDCGKGGGSKIHVYRVKSDSWSSSIQCIYSFRPGGSGSHGVFFNGALHWLGFTVPLYTSAEHIISFNISNETMVDMPLPLGCCREAYKIVGMWGDCICISIWNSGVIDVWVMHEYGVKESWSKRFTTAGLVRACTIYPCWKLLWCYDNGEILIDNDSQLLLHDSRTERVTVVWVGPDADMFTQNIRKSYVESITALGSGTYLEKRITDETVKDPE